MITADREAELVRTSDDWVDADAELGAGRWVHAAELFATLATATDDPKAHEGLAQAAWWLDDADTALGAREAAYRGFRASGEDRGAVRAAASLGYDSMLFGKGSQSGGAGSHERPTCSVSGSTSPKPAGSPYARLRSR